SVLVVRRQGLARLGAAEPAQPEPRLLVAGRGLGLDVHPVHRHQRAGPAADHRPVDGRGGHRGRRWGVAPVLAHRAARAEAGALHADPAALHAHVHHVRQRLPVRGYRHRRAHPAGADLPAHLRRGPAGLRRRGGDGAVRVADDLHHGLSAHALPRAGGDGMSTALQRLSRVRWYLVAGIVVLVAINGFPFYWMALTSLKPGTELFSYPPTFITTAPDLGGFQRLFETTNFLSYA